MLRKWGKIVDRVGWDSCGSGGEEMVLSILLMLAVSVAFDGEGKLGKGNCKLPIARSDSPALTPKLKSLEGMEERKTDALDTSSRTACGAIVEDHAEVAVMSDGQSYSVHFTRRWAA